MKPPIDASLAVLCALRAQQRAPCTMSAESIADACGCSDAAIRKIEKRALAKIQWPLMQLLGQAEFTGRPARKSQVA